MKKTKTKQTTNKKNTTKQTTTKINKKTKTTKPNLTKTKPIQKKTKKITQKQITPTKPNTNKTQTKKIFNKKKSAKKNPPKAFTKPTKKELNNKILAGIASFIIGFFLVFYLKKVEFVGWALILIGFFQSTNSFWLRFSFAQPFLFPYLFTMIKTKKFIELIELIAKKFAKVFEWVSLVSSVLGFGLVAVDYWFARKKSNPKRIIILLISSILLGTFFYYTCSILFSVPILAQLFIPCLIGFVLLGFGGMSLVMLFGYGLISLAGLFIEKQMCPALAPVLPGVPIPGFGIVIPVVGWVSLFIVLVVHELSHGVLMAYYKEKINSVGLILAGLFPIGAFVEQDDITFSKLDEEKAVLVLSAGSASNLLFIPISFVLILLFSFLTAPMAIGIIEEQNLAFSGVMVQKVEESVSLCGKTFVAPAKGKLFEGDVVKQVNGIDVNSTSSLTEGINSSNEEEIVFLVSRRNDANELIDVNINLVPVLFEDMNVKRIGVEFGLIHTGYEISLINQVLYTLITNINMILLLLLIISFAAGSFNYFPAEPFDGGKMAKIMLVPYFGFMNFDSKKETQKFIGRLFLWLLIISVLLNLIPYITLFF